MTNTTTIVVQTEADLDNAIEQIDKNAAQGNSGQSFLIQLEPTGEKLTLTQDMPLLAAGNNTVTIDGGGGVSISSVVRFPTEAHPAGRDAGARTGYFNSAG
jgi:hypothetical protein